MELKRKLADYVMDSKLAITEAIRKSGLSRAQIADRMNELIGIDEEGEGKISVSQIDSWTKRDEKRTPFCKYLPIFCVVTNNTAPLEAFVAAIGARLVSDKKINLLELGESEIERIKANRKRRVALYRMGLSEENLEEESHGHDK